jgi:hypothetical protein
MLVEIQMYATIYEIRTDIQRKLTTSKYEGRLANSADLFSVLRNWLNQRSLLPVLKLV